MKSPSTRTRKKKKRSKFYEPNKVYRDTFRGLTYEDALDQLRELKYPKTRAGPSYAQVPQSNIAVKVYERERFLKLNETTYDINSPHKDQIYHVNHLVELKHSTHTTQNLQISLNETGDRMALCGGDQTVSVWNRNEDGTWKKVAFWKVRHNQHRKIVYYLSDSWWCDLANRLGTSRLWADLGHLLVRQKHQYFQGGHHGRPRISQVRLRDQAEADGQGRYLQANREEDWPDAREVAGWEVRSLLGENRGTQRQSREYHRCTIWTSNDWPLFGIIFASFNEMIKKKNI